MTILTETIIKKAVQKAIQKTIDEAFGGLKKRIRRADMIDKIIENVIPRRYSGYSRSRMKRRIRENLRKNHDL